jgi:3-oxoacyl-[acyl-carrier-protein] synthase-3
MNLGIVATGQYVPERFITNLDVFAATGADPQWTEDVTGIHFRRYADPSQATSDLAVLATRDLQQRYPWAERPPRAIVMCTSTPDQPMPPTGSHVQDALGLDGVPTLTIDAMCAGFPWALSTAAGQVAIGAMEPPVLVVAADTYSRVLNPKHRGTVAIFGDGGGAAILDEVPSPYGLLAFASTTHGSKKDLVQIPAGGTAWPLTPDGITHGHNTFHMRGAQVTEYIMDVLPGVIQTVLGRGGVSLSDIHRIVCHQANPNILRALARYLNVSFDRFPLTAPQIGNTGSASVIITLDQADADDPIPDGALVLLLAVGGGMHTIAVLLRSIARRPR